MNDPAPRIKTVIFDLGRVVVDFDHSVICARIAEHSPFSAAELYDRFFTSGLEQLFDTGRISPARFHERIRDVAGTDMGFDAVRHAWSDIFSLKDGIETVFNRLRPCRLLCLSNTNAWHFEQCRRQFPLLNRFDGYILSYEVGARKPEHTIFMKALEQAEALPQECLYIDDVPEFVRAAQAEGINGRVFVSVDRLAAELAAYGLLNTGNSCAADSR